MGWAHKEKYHVILLCIENKTGALIEIECKEWERIEGAGWVERCLASTKTDKRKACRHSTVQ